MKFFITILISVLVLPLSAELATLNEKGFYDSFAGLKGKRCDYSVLQNGVLKASPLKRNGTNLSLLNTIKLRPVLLEEDPKIAGRWISRQFDKKLITSPQSATMEPDEIELLMTSSQGDKVKVTYNFLERDKINYNIEVIEKSKSAKAIQIGFDVFFPHLFKNLDKSIKEKKEAAAKNKKLKFREKNVEKYVKKSTEKSLFIFELKEGGRKKAPHFVRISDFLEKNGKMLNGGLKSIALDSASLEGLEVELEFNPQVQPKLTPLGKPEQRFYQNPRFRILVDPSVKNAGPIGTLYVGK